MSFNNLKFNILKFNSNIAEGGEIKPSQARICSYAQTPMLKRISKIRFKEYLLILFYKDFKFTVLTGVTFNPGNISFSSEIKLTVKVPVSPQKAELNFSVLYLPILRLYETENINLSGLVLNPGDTLTIDTENITVERNKISVIEYWQAGSRPFYLVNGRNVISYYDGSSARKAEMSVVWRERWL